MGVSNGRVYKGSVLHGRGQNFGKPNQTAMLIGLAVTLLSFQACSSLIVTMTPYNMAGKLGDNVTLACVVTDKTLAENVQWKFRANGTNTFNAITFNENVVGMATKYTVVNTYNLTVINVTTSDEGTYRCTAGTLDYDAELTAVALPKSLEISWAASPDSSITVNLTCKATYGRPPPRLRWIVSGSDVTSSAINETSTLTSRGYGNITSYLPLYLQHSLQGKLAECQATYEGWGNAMSTNLTLNINGSNGMKMSGMLLVLASVLVKLM